LGSLLWGLLYYVDHLRTYKTTTCVQRAPTAGTVMPGVALCVGGHKTLPKQKGGREGLRWRWGAKTKLGLEEVLTGHVNHTPCLLKNGREMHKQDEGARIDGSPAAG
jgi:hypothetical protein